MEQISKRRKRRYTGDIENILEVLKLLSQRLSGTFKSKRMGKCRKRKKEIINEFKAFALRGNVIDLAVGVIVGGAFSKIASSLVSDVITPIIGMFLRVLILKICNNLTCPFQKESEAVINLGTFIGTVIDFFILAVIVFIIVKLINKLKRKAEKSAEPEPVKPSEPPIEVLLLTEIRDLLKEKSENENLN